MLRKQNSFLLSVFSGLLLSAAWYWGLTILIFCAFVPLLILEDNVSSLNLPRRKLRTFLFAFLAFLIWNVLVTWWIFCVQFGKEGAIMAFVANALLMAIVFLIFSNIKNRISQPWAIWLFIPLWMAWEHFHTIWDLTWIWLTLGNVFSFKHYWIQWYEFTGTSGGSLWALILNVYIFTIIKNNKATHIFSKPILKVAMSIIVPILLSYSILLLHTPLSKTEQKCNTIVVQPNIDPYNVKFEEDYQSQFLKMLKLIRGKVTSNTQYLVLPETFITGQESVYGVNEMDIDNRIEVIWFRDSLISKYPDLKIVVGASSFKVYKEGEPLSITARKHSGGLYFDCYNAGLQIDRNGVQVYHKSKLVPAVERMPFPALFKPLEKLALDLGGTSGSLGTQEDRVSFSGNNHSLGVAPVICYESVFSDFVTEYIRKGATFIFIITNDGWWENTPGHIHHLNYARLRAIENRRQIARSANTGTSCFIDEFGNIDQPTEWWKESVITQDVYPNKRLTFFARFGDLLSYSSIFLTLLAIAYTLVLRFKK